MNIWAGLACSLYPEILTKCVLYDETPLYGEVCFNTITCADGGEWEKVCVTGEPPPPRTHHSSTCVWREKIVVFSGGDCGTKSQDNSVYLFDMSELSLELLSW